MISFNRIRRNPAAKYGNERSLCQKNHSHRSKLEGAVCDLIGLREKAGEIELLQIEATVYLTKARYRYIPDFLVKDLKTGEEFYIEAKGGKGNERWPTTKKLWKHYGPARLEVWGGTWTRPTLIQTIIPEGENTCPA